MEDFTSVWRISINFMVNSLILSVISMVVIWPLSACLLDFVMLLSLQKLPRVLLNHLHCMCTDVVW